MCKGIHYCTVGTQHMCSSSGIHDGDDGAGSAHIGAALGHGRFLDQFACVMLQELLGL